MYHKRDEHVNIRNIYRNDVRKVHHLSARFRFKVSDTVRRQHYAVHERCIGWHVI
jgi:hypothetical protein